MGNYKLIALAGSFQVRKVKRSNVSLHRSRYELNRTFLHTSTHDKLLQSSIASAQNALDAGQLVWYEFRCSMLEVWSTKLTFELCQRKGEQAVCWRHEFHAVKGPESCNYCRISNRRRILWNTNYKCLLIKVSRNHTYSCTTVLVCLTRQCVCLYSWLDPVVLQALQDEIIQNREVANMWTFATGCSHLNPVSTLSIA